ncbi:MAG: transglycosylase SLT domain-containing protein [Pseudomonadota bacterium]
MRVVGWYISLVVCLLATVGAADPVPPVSGLGVAVLPPGSFDGLRPPARDGDVPNTRWRHQPDHVLWNRAALSALKTHGAALPQMVPGDIATWCPNYEQAGMDDRRAFWVGFLSALAKFESTYKPRAVGGGGKWYGLLQILPATARGYKCNVGSGQALLNGAANLSCAVRIMAVTVPRDGVIHGRDRKWRGVTADWGPMRSASKRADMAAWLRGQSYCAPLDAKRPVARPQSPS